MSPEKKNQILGALASFGDAGATINKLARSLFLCDSGIARYILELKRSGEVVQIGVAVPTRAPIYVVGDGVTVTCELDIFEQCKQNWTGYLIHKVFGAGGAVRLADGL